jgi:guanine deaminase
MAHCIYQSYAEMDLFEKTKTKIAHCPTSNRFLMSGIMPFRRFRYGGIEMGLGTDVAGGYDLSILNEMKEAIENSKLLNLFTKGRVGPPMTVAEAFYLATLGGAKVLSMEDKIGSLKKGRMADFLVIDYSQADPMGAKSDYREPAEILERLIYRGRAGMIKHVYIEGEKIR